MIRGLHNSDRYPDYPDYRRRVPHRLLPWVL